MTAATETRDACGRFGAYLTLEASGREVNMVNGIQPMWAYVSGERRDFVWYERSLPPSFRAELAWCRGLESHAVKEPEDLPVKLRSAEWSRMLALAARPRELAPLRRIALAKLLAMLGFCRACERALAADAPPLSRGPWTEEQSQRAFLRMTARCMIAEDSFGRDYSEMAVVAERSAPRTPIRFYAAIKYMVYCLENGVVDAAVGRCDAIADETLRGLRGRIANFELKALESKWWRARAYLPFLSRDFVGTRRWLGRARERALESLESSPPESRAFAEESLYAVGQTQGVSELHAGFPRESRRWLEDMKRRDPAGAWQRHWLGMAHAALGDNEAAREELIEARRLAPPGADRIAAELARVCGRLGRSAEVKRWREEAARLASGGKRRPPEPVPRRDAASAQAASAGASLRARVARAERLLLAGDLTAGWGALVRALSGATNGAASFAALGGRDERVFAALDRLARGPRAKKAALSWRGLLRWRIGDRAGAVFDLSRGDDRRAPLLLALAECELRTHNRRCLARIASVLRREPEQARALALAREAVRAFGLSVSAAAPDAERAGGRVK